CIRRSEKDTTADLDEDLAESFENGLAFEVTLKLLPCMPALPIALHGEAPCLALDHEVNPISSYVVREALTAYLAQHTQHPTVSAWGAGQPLARPRPLIFEFR